MMMMKSIAKVELPIRHSSFIRYSVETVRQQPQQQQQKFLLYTIVGTRTKIVVIPSQKWVKCTIAANNNSRTALTSISRRYMSSIVYQPKWFYQYPQYQQQTFYNNYIRWFGSNHRRKRSSSRISKDSKGEEYWEKVYEQSKEQMELLNVKKGIQEPKDLTDVISYKVLFVMGITPILICLMIPELRNHMFDSFTMTKSNQSLDTSTATSTDDAVNGK